MFTRKLNAFAVASAALLFCAAPALAQQTGTEQTAPHHRSSMQSSMNNKMSDEMFAKEAARGGIAEVKLGQLAEDKGQSDAVKDFGKRMVADHSKANDQLQGAASQINLQLPTEPSRMDQEQYTKLSKLSGKAFDRAYARDMLKDHEKDVAAFRHEAKYGKNQDIKNFASLTLPTLEDHLKQARQMYHSVEGGGTKTTGGSSQR